MGRIHIFLVAFFAFCSISFSSLVWQGAAGGPVASKPIVFNNAILVTTTDGSATLLNANSGNKIWKLALSGTSSQPVLLQSWAIVATDKGKISYIKNDGSVEKEVDLGNQSYNVTFLYGIDASDTKLFVTTDKGLFVVATGGTNISLIYNSTTIKSPPTFASNSIFFGEDDKLVKMNDKGAAEWRTDVGGIWLSRPAVDGQSVYVGGLDNKLHALTLSGGAERWVLDTGNWVLSSPVIKDNVIYFGSNDGMVYAVHNDGRLLWSTHTPLAIETKPEFGSLGGRQVIFTGSTANAIYAIEIENGTRVWKGSAGGWVADPLFYQKKIIFGSQDKSVYSFSTERACSITSPADGQITGPKEIKVTGNVVSESGSPTVSVSVNDGTFDTANTSEDSWIYYLNPSSLNAGLNKISCKVSDSGGEESGTLTSVEIVKDPSINLSNLVVSTSGSLIEGQEFTIHVNDGDDGSPVERFTVTLDGQSINGSGTVNVTLSAGSYQMTVKKIGFKDSVKTINIASTGISPIYLGLGVVAIMAIVYLIYRRFFKK